MLMGIPLLVMIKSHLEDILWHILAKLDNILKKELKIIEFVKSMIALLYLEMKPCFVLLNLEFIILYFIIVIKCIKINDP